MWPYTPTEVAFLLLGSTWSDLSVGKSCRASQEGCSLTNQVIPISSSGKGEVDRERVESAWHLSYREVWLWRLR